MKLAAFTACFLQLVTLAHSELATEEKFLKINAKRADTKLQKRESGYLKQDADFIVSGYYVDVLVGSNNDSLKVILDTGSSDFWFPSTSNPYCSSDSKFEAYCSEFGTFDESNSTSYKSNGTEFSLGYADGTVAIGTFGRDSVVFGGQIIEDVNMAVANYSNITHGILGIGYEATESTDFETASSPYKYVNFPKKLVDDGFINKAAYSMYTVEDNNAEILFGAVDHSQYVGDFYQYPIVDINSTDETTEISRIAITLNQWTVKTDKVEAIVGQGYIPAVLDSGTTTAIIPVEIAEVIANLLGLQYDNDIEKYFGACSSLEDIYFTFNFQGVDYTSPVASYFLNVIEDDASQGCLFEIFISEEEFIVLGDSFLRDFYLTIDLDDDIAALAPRNFNPGSAEIDVITSGIPSANSPPSSETFGYSNYEFNYYTQTTTQAISAETTYSMDTAFSTLDVNSSADAGTSSGSIEITATGAPSEKVTASAATHASVITKANTVATSVTATAATSSSIAQVSTITSATKTNGAPTFIFSPYFALISLLVSFIA